MIYLGSDHGGFELKEKIKKWLDEARFVWQDLGNTVYDKEDDYPQFAFLVAEKVALEEKKLPLNEENNDNKVSWNERPKGILCCRSSAGMVIAANKIKGIRCTTAFNTESAKHSREHNDANILAISGDWLKDDQAKEILFTWLKTEFSGEERHVRRLKKIEEYEEKSKNQIAKIKD